MSLKSIQCPRLTECRAGYIGNTGHMPKEHKKEHPRNLRALPSRMFGDGRACWSLAGLLFDPKDGGAIFLPNVG